MNPGYLEKLRGRLVVIAAGGATPASLDTTIEILDQLVETQKRLLQLEDHIYEHSATAAAHKST
jgi:hypothetical protein